MFSSIMLENMTTGGSTVVVNGSSPSNGVTSQGWNMVALTFRLFGCITTLDASLVSVPSKICCSPSSNKFTVCLLCSCWLGLRVCRYQSTSWHGPSDLSPSSNHRLCAAQTEIVRCQPTPTPRPCTAHALACKALGVQAAPVTLLHRFHPTAPAFEFLRQAC